MTQTHSAGQSRHSIVARLAKPNQPRPPS